MRTYELATNRLSSSSHNKQSILSFIIPFHPIPSRIAALYLGPRGLSTRLPRARAASKGAVLGGLSVLSRCMQGGAFEPMGRHVDAMLETVMSFLLAESYEDFEIQKSLSTAALCVAGIAPTRDTLLRGGPAARTLLQEALQWLLQYVQELQSTGEKATQPRAAAPPVISTSSLQQLLNETLTLAPPPSSGAAAPSPAPSPPVAATAAPRPDAAKLAELLPKVSGAAGAGVTQTARFLSFSLAAIGLLMPAVEDPTELEAVARMASQISAARHSSDTLSVARALLHRLLIQFNTWLHPSTTFCLRPPDAEAVRPEVHSAIARGLAAGLADPVQMEGFLYMIARERQLPQEAEHGGGGSARQQMMASFMQRPENMLGMALTGRFSVLFFPCQRAIKGTARQMFKSYNALIFESMFVCLGPAALFRAAQPTILRMLEKQEAAGRATSPADNAAAAAMDDGSLPTVPTGAGALRSAATAAAQGDERGRWCLCSEFLCAAISSGAAFAVDPDAPGPAPRTYMETFVGDALRRGFRNTPLELSSCWNAAVRWALLRLAWSPERERPDWLAMILESLLADVAGPFAGGAPSASDLTRAVKRLAHALEELAMHSMSASVAAVFLGLVERAVAPILGLRAHESQQVRMAAARCLSTLVALTRGALAPFPALPTAPIEAILTQARATVLADLRAGSEAVARVSHVAGSAGPIGDAAGASTPMDVDIAPATSSAPDRSVTDRLSFALLFLNHILKYHAPAADIPFFLECMTPVAVLHESPVPELQTITDCARLTLRRFKYLPLYGPDLQRMCEDVIPGTRHASQYWVRAFGLVLTQTTAWFRHALVFDPRSLGPLVAFVEAALTDPKQEVREIASNTLSGLLRGLDAEAFETLRKKFIKAAGAGRGTGARKRPHPEGSGAGLAAATANGAAAGGPSALEAVAREHGVVLGLRSFVLASPYAVPAWLPGVLLAMVRVASPAKAAPVVKRTAQKTLASFRATHQDDKEELKRNFDEEEWDAILSVDPPATYIS